MMALYSPHRGSHDTSVPPTPVFVCNINPCVCAGQRDSVGQSGGSPGEHDQVLVYHPDQGQEMSAGQTLSSGPCPIHALTPPLCLMTLPINILTPPLCLMTPPIHILTPLSTYYPSPLSTGPASP